MGERFRTRALVVGRALARRAMPRRGDGAIRRVLVAHNLLLGDTVMLTPLVAKLRAAHPDAEITLLATPSAVPLYAGRPYGVRALPFAPASSATTRALLREPPQDLAIVAGDNRYSWLAAAMGAPHIVAHDGARNWRRDWFVDERRAYASTPGAWGDMVAALVDGPEPAPYARGDWPAPPAAPFALPASPYAVLHVGASTPLKRWEPARWRELALALAARGLRVAWSAGRGEEALVAACDPEARFESFAGRLDLAQLWRLFAHASLVVSPDTGAAHVARAAWAPTVVLFGPGSSTVVGAGRFWRDTPWRAVTVEPFPCRDQQVLFGRHVEWVRRCGRSTRECAEPRCMQAIGIREVLAAVDSLQAGGTPPALEGSRNT
jgi:ADP-heptose:LPS heptosyltransferase